MSLRDYFAAKVLSGAIAGRNTWPWGAGAAEECAREAYRIADAMLRARAAQSPAERQSAHLAEFGEMSDWQPIKTAPVDGTEIVLWMDGVWQRVTFGAWRQVEGPSDWPFLWHCRDGLYTPDVPTHWMPLPESPR